MAIERDVLNREQYSGTIAVCGQSFPITVSLVAGADCRLRIETEKLEPKLYLAIEKASGRPGQYETLMSLDVSSAKGRRFTSDHVGSRGGGMDHHQLEAGLGVLAWKAQAAVAKPALRKYIRGFEVFPLELATPLGRLFVFGPMRAANRDSVAGGIALEFSSEHAPPDWRERADAFLTHILMGLTIADGGRLHAPVIEFFEGDHVEVTFVAGRSFARELPLQHHLNLEPIVQALIDRFFKGGALNGILYTALGWTQIDTTIDEVRFITAMTALEALISSQLKGEPGGLLKPSDFTVLRTDLEKVVEARALEEKSKRAMKSRIGNLNYGSFARNIDRLIDRYGVARTDLDEKAIGGLITLRNRIIHDGIAPDGVDLWDGIILVRELVMRILMSEIGYVGPYNCYIGGLHTRAFPSCVAPQASGGPQPV